MDGHGGTGAAEADAALRTARYAGARLLELAHGVAGEFDRLPIVAALVAQLGVDLLTGPPRGPKSSFALWAPTRLSRYEELDRAAALAPRNGARDVPGVLRLGRGARRTRRRRVPGRTGRPTRAPPVHTLLPHRRAAPRGAPPRPRPWLCDLPGVLTRANAGLPRLEPGWRIVGLDGPSVVVERDGLRIWARPDEVETRNGDTASLRTPVDLPAVSPGFHCARGETPERDEPDDLDRFYWHLRPSGAVPFMRAATEHLNRHGVPFFLKVIADPDAFGRADAGVLVLARRDREKTVPIVRELHTRLSRHLEPPVPAFTKALAPGLGFAQEPAHGMSFGTSRCRIVAQALVTAYERTSIPWTGGSTCCAVHSPTPASIWTAPTSDPEAVARPPTWTFR